MPFGGSLTNVVAPLDLEWTPCDKIRAMKSKPREDSAPRYSISQMSALTGYTPDTLRFYEKSGLLPGIKRCRGRRVYTDADCYAIGIVTCFKDTGMPLGEIRRYMALAAKGERSVDERLAIMKRQAESIKSQMAELKLCEARILFKVWYYETAKKEGFSAVEDMEAALARYRKETKRKVTFDMPRTGHETFQKKGTNA